MTPERKSPDVRVRAGEKEEARVTSSYPAGAVAVNASCWNCSYFHHPAKQRRANIRQRIRFVCSFHGHAASPETPACEFFTATAEVAA